MHVIVYLDFVSNQLFVMTQKTPLPNMVINVCSDTNNTQVKTIAVVIILYSHTRRIP